MGIRHRVLVAAAAAGFGLLAASMIFNGSEAPASAADLLEEIAVEQASSQPAVPNIAPAVVTVMDVAPAPTAIGPEVRRSPLAFEISDNFGRYQPADLDRDGQLTVNDFLTFQRLFESSGGAADFNGDGRIDVLDIGAFVDSYITGEWVSGLEAC